jgi:hypothetical protein
MLPCYLLPTLFRCALRARACDVDIYIESNKGNKGNNVENKGLKMLPLVTLLPYLGVVWAGIA